MRHELSNIVGQLKTAMDRVSFADREIYKCWLSQAYFFVRHSTPLLALSCGRSVNLPEYHLRCIAHLSEERAHDRLLLEDLKSLGSKPQDYPEMAMTSALYQAQYYWIEHRNPISFLGYIYVLEALAVLCGSQKAMEANVHSGSTRFLRLHAGEDVAHLEQAILQIEQLSPSDQKDILENAKLTTGIYLEMLRSIESSVAMRQRDGVAA